jgi:hypothetical protein
MLSRLAAVLTVVAAAACSSTPAPIVPDTRLYFDADLRDASFDAGLPDSQTAPGCDFVQRDHASLPDWEVIPFDYTGQPITICGSIDLLHSSQSGEDNFAMDTTFAISVKASYDVKLVLTADAPIDVFQGGVSLTTNGVSFVTSPSSMDLVGELYTGENPIILRASYPTTATTPISYKLTIQPYDFSTLCPKLTTPVEYTESHDGQLSNGNDVFGHSGSSLVLTSNTSDSPELTGLTINSGSAHRVDGVSAAVPQQLDEGNDRDTYQITTGSDTTALVVRSTPFVDPTITAFVFYTLTTPALDIAEASGNAHNGPTLRHGLGILPVKPSTTYWLQVEGASLAGNTAGLPIAYDLSICGLNAPL